MSSITVVAVSALLLGLFLLIVAVMVWQESGRRRVPAQPMYVIEDAISHAMASLPVEVSTRLGVAGVRRIIEWSAFYLQGLADKKAARKGITVVAGGDERAIAYIEAELAKREIRCRRDDIEAVLNAEAGYLASLGVVGAAVSEEELR